MENNPIFKKRTFSILFILIFFLIIALYINRKTNDTQDEPLLTDTQIALDTVVTISIYDSTDEDILQGAFNLCKSYEKVFSRTLESSELYKLNNSSQLTVSVSNDLASIIRTGLKYSKMSNGAFDISIAPVSSLWDFKTDTPEVPDADKIKAALRNISYKNFSVSKNTVTRTSPENQIDLGAIAKGYIADKIKTYLLNHNVHSAVINLGGNILLVGSKPDGSDFNIGIQAPFEDQDETIASLQISNKSIVTSGIYERYFIKDDTLYHHILNPKTGYPYDNDLMSVTIISDQSTDGDALSTACFAMGLEDGLKYIESHDNLDAIFITQDGKKHYSSGIFERLNITDTET